jgi:hypothetical protein
MWHPFTFSSNLLAFWNSKNCWTRFQHLSEMWFCECWNEFGTTWQQANNTSLVHLGYRKTGLVWKCGNPAALSTPSCLLLVVLSSSPSISKPHRGPSPFRVAASLHPSLVPTCNASIGKQLNFSCNLYPVWILYKKCHVLLLSGYLFQGEVLCK